MKRTFKGAKSNKAPKSNPNGQAINVKQKGHKTSFDQRIWTTERAVKKKSVESHTIISQEGIKDKESQESYYIFAGKKKGGGGRGGERGAPGL